MADKSKASQQVETEELEALQRLRTIAPADFVAKVFRQPAEGKGWEWLDDWVGGEIPSQAQLRERYGGGLFKLELRDAGGKFVPGGTASIRIAGVPKVEAAASPASTVDATVKFALETLRDTMRDKAQAGPPQRESIATLITAVSGAIVALAQILQPRGPGQPPLAAQLGELKDLVAVLKELTPEPPEPSVAGDGMPAALVTAATKLVDVVREQRALTKGTPPTTPAPVDAPALEAQPAAAGTLAAILAPYAGQLLELAADDADPETWADAILERLEKRAPAAVDYLAEQLTASDVQAKQLELDVMAALPQLEPYRAWVQRLLGEMRKMLAAPPDQPADAGSPPAP